MGGTLAQEINSSSGAVQIAEGSGNIAVNSNVIEKPGAERDLSFITQAVKATYANTKSDVKKCFERHLRRDKGKSNPRISQACQYA